jgi:hypothetical protein
VSSKSVGRRGEHGGNVWRVDGGVEPGFDLFEVGRRDLLEHVRRDRAKPSGKQVLQGQRLAFELALELSLLLTFEPAFELA